MASSRPAAACDDSTIWGMPQEFSFVVQAQQATLDVVAASIFSSERLAVRSTLRVALGFPHPSAVVKIEIGGSQARAAVLGRRRRRRDSASHPRRAPSAGCGHTRMAGQQTLCRARTIQWRWCSSTTVT